MLVITFDESEEEVIHKICDMFETGHIKKQIPINRHLNVFGELKIDSRKRGCFLQRKRGGLESSRI